MNYALCIPVKPPELRSTLWSCDRCASFITVHSAAELIDVWCPVCDSQKMTPCGSFADVLQLTSEPCSGNWC